MTDKRPRAAWVAAEAQALKNNQPQPVFQPGFDRWRYDLQIVLGVDTSGSIARQTLELFAAEIIGIARRTQAAVHILCFDDVVYHEETIALENIRKTLINIDFRREGGTSFDDLFTKATALDPTVIVVLTDLDAPLPSTPAAPVIWAVNAAPKRRPTFGKLVDIRG